MVSVIVYFLISYVCLIPLAVISTKLVSHTIGAPYRNFACISLIVVVAAMPLVPYALIEYRTAINAQRLRTGTREALNEIGFDHASILSLKVLSITQKSAIVYVACLRSTPQPLCANGLVVTLTRQNNEWKFISQYESIWSDCSSASGNIFPPYPAKNAYKY